MADPTPMTTAQLLRELTNLKENVAVRLEAIDKATALFEENLTRVPTEVDKAVGHLKELHSEKFSAVEMKFKERDHLRDEIARSGRAAIDAALSAAKESVNKNEASMTKQIDGMMLLIGKIESGFNDKLENLKQLFMTIQNNQSATAGRSSGASNLWGIIAGVAGLLIAAIALVASFKR